MGHEVGAIACALLPDGFMVEAEPDLAAALATTAELLASGHDRPIFEATLEHDGVLVRIDVLEPDGEGGWHMAEVKSSSKPKDYHIGDLATQLWVARATGMQVTSAAIRHINTAFVLAREGEYDGLFADSDLMAAAEPIVAERSRTVTDARTVLAGSEPIVATGNHCDTPFPCDFAAYCHAGLPSGPEWPVTVLPYGGGKRWIEKGIDDLLKIDAAALTNATHKRVYEATVSASAYHDVEGARAEIVDWSFPRTWLDFETIAFAVPRWVGTRPFQQIPFQFSAHVELADGTIDHREFLSLDGLDPRRSCAEALVAIVPATGAVIGYNAAFERSRIVELAEAFSDLAVQLRDIADRIVDLLPVTRANWYHRDQRGSWSIKAVLPTIAPELSYSGLDIADGTSAQVAYLEAIAPDTAATRKDEIDTALRIYCGRDTEAMIVLARKLTTA